MSQKNRYKYWSGDLYILRFFTKQLRLIVDNIYVNKKNNYYTQ